VSGSGLILPASCRRQVQMSKPVCFWRNKKRDHLMNAPGPDVVPPTGYEKIECRHAHEVEKWSNALRAQETRIRQMDDQERFEYEDALRADMLAEMRKNLAESTDLVNRVFMAKAIEHFEQQREKARPIHIKRETYQACEAEEGVAS